MGEKRYILFLDDQAERAALFSNRSVGEDRARTVWVRTSEEAVAALEEFGLDNFDRIHLDHDLGQEYQDSRSERSGMEVVRWLEKHGPSVSDARVVVHSWNLPAGKRMVERLTAAGFRVIHQPFGMGR